MAERGYLWDDLTAEIAAEFSQLTDTMPSVREIAARIVVDEFRFQKWRAKESKRIPADLLLKIKNQARRENLKQALKAQAAARPEKPKKKRAPRIAPVPDANQIKYQKRKIRDAQKKELAMREKMPSERTGVTQRFVLTTRNFNPDGSLGEGVREIKGYITASVYPLLRDDGSPHPLAGALGEVFVKIGKAGSNEALLDQWAVSFSRELQRGESLEVLCKKHQHTQFEPSGAVSGIEGVTRCSSPVDLVCSWLVSRFSGKHE